MGYSEAPIPSPRLGEVRWSDIRGRVEADVTEVDLLVISHRMPPITATVRLGRRWAGGGWCTAFECPGCRQVASVLRAADGELVCAKCRPHLTVRQREKNTRPWTHFDGLVEDQLLRAATRRNTHPDVDRLATTIVSRDQARVDSCSREVESMILAADAFLASQPR